MKNKTDQIILTYLLPAVFIVVMSYGFLKHYSIILNSFNYFFVKDLVFILITILFFRYNLNKNHKTNTRINQRSNETNATLKQSKEAGKTTSTKQKEDENRLKLLETVFTEARESIIITEAISEDYKFPRIVFANPAFGKMSGYNHSEIIGESLFSFVSKNSDIREINKITQAIKNQEECFAEITFHKKNQSEYWVRISFIPVYNLEQKLSHWISIQRDITEDKKSEKEKEILISELTQHNKDLKQFSYITSHNLRAPLSNLTGLLNLIEDIPIEDSNLKEIITGFRISTLQLNETINDLTQVVTTKNSLTIQNEEIEIGEVFKNIIHQLKLRIENIKPELNINFGNVTKIKTNKVYLENILLNLFTNSLKYRSDNRALVINIDLSEKNKIISMSFKDNGIGIDLERHKNKVFGFYQTFHNYQDCKGLGLFLVKSQIKTMGGTINIQSEVEKGTEFIITFKTL